MACWVIKGCIVELTFHSRRDYFILYLFLLCVCIKGVHSYLHEPISVLWSVITCPVGSQVNTSCLNPSQPSRYLIYLPQRDGRLSWPGCSKCLDICTHCSPEPAIYAIASWAWCRTATLIIYYDLATPHHCMYFFSLQDIDVFCWQVFGGVQRLHVWTGKGKFCTSVHSSSLPWVSQSARCSLQAHSWRLRSHRHKFQDAAFSLRFMWSLPEWVVFTFTCTQHITHHYCLTSEQHMSIDNLYWNQIIFLYIINNFTVCAALIII